MRHVLVNLHDILAYYEVFTSFLPNLILRHHVRIETGPIFMGDLSV